MKNSWNEEVKEEEDFPEENFSMVQGIMYKERIHPSIQVLPLL